MLSFKLNRCQNTIIQTTSSKVVVGNFVLLLVTILNLELINIKQMKLHTIATENNTLHWSLVHCGAGGKTNMMSGIFDKQPTERSKKQLWKWYFNGHLQKSDNEQTPMFNCFILWIKTYSLTWRNISLFFVLTFVPFERKQKWTFLLARNIKFYQ